MLPSSAMGQSLQHRNAGEKEGQQSTLKTFPSPYKLFPFKKGTYNVGNLFKPSTLSLAPIHPLQNLDKVLLL